MFTLPISETHAIAIDDSDEDSWSVYTVDFDKWTFESFDVEGEGSVQGAHYDESRDLVWIVAHGALFALQPSEEELFGAPQPPKDFFIYAVLGNTDQVYACGEYQNLWQFSWSSKQWTPLLEPGPKPPRSDDAQTQSQRVKEYARNHPPLYAGFAVGSDFVFCGALGALVRVRQGNVETTEIATGARLVSGHAENGHIVLSGDSNGAEIYKGDFDSGFELFFADKQPSLHRTALNDGDRFIAIAEYPASNLHNLYIYEDEELIPYNTGCAREPFPLTSLSTIGDTLWATDLAGMFRRKNGKWSYVGIEDLKSGAWPEDA
ncbi:hypothetical protein [uncultured Tateyamaria sp.]|uniref:hypothetical protein n=1 Tax=uncultured Tateyamaria sp. TaxID=455651 RepID=UPI0026189DD8|nr:hypothetical protein [uncultured Tateyamaria sp.]